MLKKGLEAIVGKKYVLDHKPTLEAFSKDLSLNKPRRPSLVVKPKNTEEVQQVVKLANKHLVPLIPVSSGVHFHGETIPEQGGVVVDLRRMDKVVQAASNFFIKFFLEFFIIFIKSYRLVVKSAVVPRRQPGKKWGGWGYQPPAWTQHQPVLKSPGNTRGCVTLLRVENQNASEVRRQVLDIISPYTVRR